MQFIYRIVALLLPCIFLYPASTDEPVPKKAADKIKEVAGSAEFLRSVPKRFATLKAVAPAEHRVTLLIDGESLPKVWPLVADAEMKKVGWWGRLDQFHAGERVWVWFKTDRQQQPVAISMMADELSEQDIHGRSSGDKAAFEARRAEQKSALEKRWTEEGLPGTVTFLHIFSGEMDFMLDHEAMRWGRSLKLGDKVTLQATPPIQAVVKHASPWRERTQLRLVVHSKDQADLTVGQRLMLRMDPLPAEAGSALLPLDLDRPRTKGERIDWFLANIYCTCGIKGDNCTGHFYTLASCNPNGCGMPNAMRKTLGEKIDKGLSDKQIFEELLNEQGPDLLRQHLMP